MLFLTIAIRFTRLNTRYELDIVKVVEPEMRLSLNILT